MPRTTNSSIPWPTSDGGYLNRRSRVSVNVLTGRIVYRIFCQNPCFAGQEAYDMLLVELQLNRLPQNIEVIGRLNKG